MFTLRFWKLSAERFVRSGAASLASLLTGGLFNAFTVDWTTTLGVAAGAAVYSLLMSLAGSQVGDKGDPSLLPRRRVVRK